MEWTIVALVVGQIVLMVEVTGLFLMFRKLVNAETFRDLTDIADTVESTHCMLEEAVERLPKSRSKKPWVSTFIPTSADVGNVE